MVDSKDFVWYRGGDISFKLTNNVRRYTQRDFESLVAEHKRELGTDISGLHPNFANEFLYRFMCSNQDKVILGITTGRMAKALQALPDTPEHRPVAVQGMISTLDNKLILGVRSKPDYRPEEPTDYQLALAPNGYATFDFSGSLLVPFYKGLDEELRLSKRDLYVCRIAGHHFDSEESNAAMFTIRCKTDLYFRDVEERWKQSRDKYECLVAIDDNPQAIREFLAAEDFSQYGAKGVIRSEVVPPLEFYLENGVI